MSLHGAGGIFGIALVSYPSDQIRDLDFDRANFLTGITQTGCGRQHPGRFQALNLGIQYFSDGARIGKTIGMTADSVVHRTVAEAGAAANALKRLSPIRVGKDLRTAIVQNDQMHFFRAVFFPLLARRCDHIDIRGD